ncbi:MAG: ComF family protein [Caulobacteraceae bacterium]
MQDLIFPHHAFDAGSRAASPGLTPEGWSRIAFLEAPACDGCGLPFDHEMGQGVRCPACEAQPRAFARARAACLYDEHSRDLILQFKHADRLDLARLFSLWLSRAAIDLIEDADVVVPVPMHPLRLIRRRYNQAAEIGRPLARRAGLAYWPGALKRRRAGESQAGKSGAGRRRNVQGAYVCPPGWDKRLRGQRVLLVDDVMTTGATAEACAKALVRAGAARVDVAVIARVRESGGVSI